jgi:aspartate aminotransferase-like enzyme
MESDHPTIDLRTAQNTVHSFLVEAVEEARSSGEIAHISADQSRRDRLAEETEALLFDLMCVSPEAAADYSMAIADSGKRAIEVMVNSFCTEQPDATIAVTNENYVGHNKWSAATAHEKLKGIPMQSPFKLGLGAALTCGSEPEMDQARHLIESNVDTFYIAWNSTSTGVEEQVEELVKHRDTVGSRTLVLADASSLDILSRRWQGHSALPDALFFSFRKHPSIPYDGPQDELEQMKSSGSALLFNNRALQRAREIQAEPIYDLKPGRSFSDRIPAGEKHTTHLLRLNTLLRHSLSNGGTQLERIDETRQAARTAIIDAFSGQCRLAQLGFSLLADPAVQSSTSYVVSVPGTLDAGQLIKRLEQDAGVSISPALHPLANTKNHNIVRFAVYSASTLEEIETMLGELAAVAERLIHERHD